MTECPIEEEGQMKRLCFGGDYSDFDSPNKKSGRIIGLVLLEATL